MEGDVRNTRRSFLKKVALLLAGGLGAFLVIGRERADAVAVQPPHVPLEPEEASLKLFGRRWHLYSQQRRKGELPAMGDQMVVYGELMKDPEGVKIGEFYSSCLHIRSPFGSGPLAASNVEVHTFNLMDGSILGMGVTRGMTGGEAVFAILSGTGRYATARGSYTARQRPQELGGDGTAEFSFNLRWERPGALV